MGPIESSHTIGRMKPSLPLRKIVSFAVALSSILIGWSGLLLTNSGLTIAQSVPSPAPQNPSPMVDTTRPHFRIEKQEVAGHRFPLSTGTLYLSPQFRPRDKVPLIIHFHGASWLLEYDILKALPQAALVTVQLGAGSGIYEKTFSDSAAFELLLNEALTQITKFTGHEVRWRSITLTSFSAGYGAVRSILRQAENYRRVNAIFLADSLHTSYVPEGKPGKLEEGPLDVFVQFAQDAASRRKSMWMTHSEVYPGTFASTTETADYLLGRLKIKRETVLHPGPVGMQQLSHASIGNFHLAGFAGNSAQDHMDHLYAMGKWMKQLKAVVK